jgi:lysozyme family protein
LIDDILRREGSKYTEIPGDAGGATKWGITRDTLAGFRGRAVSKQEVADLTEEEARRIYETRYIQKPGYWRINNPDLQNLIVDCGVNHGPDRASRWLQTAVGAPVDGLVGRQTAELTNTKDAREVFAKVLCLRLQFYEVLDDRPGQQKFDKGWTNRCCEFVMILARMK